jgi:tetratricopeptide (TPR) repeat protein
VGHEAAGAARLDALLALFGDAIEDPVRDRQVLADLASIRHEPGVGVEPLPPERLRAATLALLDRFLCARATAAAQLVLFEDMHWADPTTTEWFERVVDLAEGLRMLVIATARPEFVFAIAGRTHVTSLSLARLGRGETERIIADQSDDRTLPRNLIERIAERSDGIPLYAEELTRSILEFGASEGAIPPTLQASLMGRLDRLGPAREVAQAAAVIGRAFDRALLVEIVPHGPRALDRALDALLASKLVLRRGAAEAGSLQFKHALVRDAAYDSLLRKQRETFHRTLAEVLIARVGAGADMALELIAHHLVHGAEDARSVPYWQEAARLALRKGAEGEASVFCREGLKALDKIDDARARDEARFELMILRYMSEYKAAEVEELIAVVELAEDCALRLKDPLRRSRALDAKAYLLASNGRVTEAIEAGRKCVSLSLDLGDDNAFVGANMMLGRALFAAGDYRDAVRQGVIVRDYLGDDVERGHLDSPMNQTISSRVWLCFIQSELGAFEAAEKDIGEARQFLSRVSAPDHIGLWVALGWARLESLRGNHQGVIEALEPQLELCRRDYPVYMPRLALSFGYTLVATGQAPRGLTLLAEADEVSHQKRFIFSWALLLTQYARALLLTGDAAGSEAVARRAMKIAADAGESGNAGWARLAAGEAIMALGRENEGRALIGAATQIAIPRGMAPLMGLCNALLGSAPPTS